MNPDDYEPLDHCYPEWEGEVTTSDGSSWYVIVTVRGTREPGQKPEFSIAYAEAQVFPAFGNEYSTQALEGARLAEWIGEYSAEVARIVSEKIDDSWVNAREEQDARHW